MKTQGYIAFLLIMVAPVVDGRTLFNVTFDNPPHVTGIAGDNTVVPPADRFWEVFGNNSITNYSGMDGQAAFIDLGYIQMFFGGPLPPYTPVSTSGLNIISFKVAFTHCTAPSDYPPSGLTYQWYIRTESLASGDPYLWLRFEYFGGTAGVVRVSHNGFSTPYEQIASFTTGVTYSVVLAIDLDTDSYSVWIDGALLLENKASGPWQTIMDVGMGATAEGDRIIDDVKWTVLDRPQITLEPLGYISWQSDSGTMYRLEKSYELNGSDWTNVGIEVVATNTVTTISEPIRYDGIQFYRLKAE
jgi:hypothetical protein